MVDLETMRDWIRVGRAEEMDGRRMTRLRFAEAITHIEELTFELERMRAEVEALRQRCGSRMIVVPGNKPAEG
jgi:hypothetical protein